jgi:hypothetical protein
VLGLPSIIKISHMRINIYILLRENRKVKNIRK